MVAREIAGSMGVYDQIAFLDDNSPLAMFPNYDIIRKTEAYLVGCFSFIPLIRGYSARMNISKIELYASLGTIQKYRILRKWRKIGIFILRRLRNPY